MIQIKSHSLKIPQKIIFIVLLQLVVVKSLDAQYNVDSIRNLSFDELKKNFEKSFVDSVKDLIYANVYLEKAKKDKDILKIADAYYYFSIISEYKAGLKYADSVIIITKTLKGNKQFPALGYFSKGRIYYYLGELQMAIEQYVKAHFFAKQNKNDILLAKIKSNIGAIKNRLGEKEEALEIYKDFVSFVKESEIPNKDFLLANGLLALGITYISTQKYDSADIVLKKGLTISRNKKYIDIHAALLNQYGINLFYTKSYKASIDSISKALKISNLKNNLAFAYLHLGKSNLALGDTASALAHFFRVDTFLCNNNFIMQELLEAYPPIINYYKQSKDYINQLFYTNQLIKFDSIFYATKTIASKDIAKKYDIPLLIVSKEETIAKLNKDRSSSITKMYFLFFFLLLSIISVLFFIIKNRKFKKKFNKLIDQLNEKEINKTVENKVYVTEEIETENILANLGNDLVNSVLIKLNEFEKTMRFTESSYTLNKLAKELKTNSSYLSKIINDHKKKNFPNYLKSLRVDLAINRLKNEPKFRTFTIQAIAEEVGFNKAQSFSTAFYNKTGLYPSYFIKQLEKHETKRE